MRPRATPTAGAVSAATLRTRPPSCRRRPSPPRPSRGGSPWPAPSTVDLSRPGRYVSQREAARLAGVSKDSIIRARRAGRLPGARRVGTQWEIAIDDLAAAGLLLPADHHHDPGVPADVTGSRIELARAQARVSALEDVIARQDEELRFLRRFAEDALAARGANE